MRTDQLDNQLHANPMMECIPPLSRTFRSNEDSSLNTPFDRVSCTELLPLSARVALRFHDEKFHRRDRTLYPELSSWLTEQAGSTANQFSFHYQLIEWQLARTCWAVTARSVALHGAWTVTYHELPSEIYGKSLETYRWTHLGGKWTGHKFQSQCAISRLPISHHPLPVEKFRQLPQNSN